MVSKSDKENKDSLQPLADLVLNLIKGDYTMRLPLKGENAIMDAICNNLNSLADELQVRDEARKEDKRRLNDVAEALLLYAVLDFSKKIKLSNEGDEIDAVAAGLNALVEELQYSFLAQQQYARDLVRSNSLLVETNEKIQAVFDNAPDAIIVADLNFKITGWNKAAEKMYGYTSDEVMGRLSEEFIHSEYISPLTRQRVIEEINVKGSWRGELIHVTKRKGRRKVLSSASMFKNEKGLPIGYLGVNRDITDMRNTEAKLFSTEKQFHLVVNEVLDYAIILLDPNGIITSWNKGAEKINGYTENEIIGKHFSIFYTHDDLKKGVPGLILEEAVRDKKLVSKGWRVKKDGSLFWADVVITELLDEDGKLKGFVKITRDLTEQRIAEQEILRKTEELKRSNTELEQFAYVASHDLQEPLRMITSYVQLLEKQYKDKLDQNANDFINYAVDGASRMQTLIYSLLEYSRINRIQPFEWTNLDDTLTEVLKDLKVVIKETNAKVTWKNLPDVFVDKVLIGQLFFNLIANAIKFKGPVPPEISITAKRENSEIVFSVKDNGIGIKKEYAEKIFVIFQRLHSKDKYPGTGIGLAICKKIVERHEGRIWVESDLNKGSTFFFTIRTNLVNRI